MNFKPPLAAALMGVMVSNTALGGKVANTSRLHSLGLQGGVISKLSNF